MRRPTLAQVAELAGVSLKTASRAMNGEYGVASATAERVLEAARSQGHVRLQRCRIGNHHWADHTWPSRREQAFSGGSENRRPRSARVS